MYVFTYIYTSLGLQYNSTNTKGNGHLAHVCMKERYMDVRKHDKCIFICMYVRICTHHYGAPIQKGTTGNTCMCKCMEEICMNVRKFDVYVYVCMYICMHVYAHFIVGSIQKGTRRNTTQGNTTHGNTTRETHSRLSKDSHAQTYIHPTARHRSRAYGFCLPDIHVCTANRNRTSQTSDLVRLDVSDIRFLMSDLFHESCIFFSTSCQPTLEVNFHG